MVLPIAAHHGTVYRISTDNIELVDNFCVLLMRK
ncbi:hypothetical protein EPIR_3579 [Erwinia piriflorinigrans CFBP 5888]|uniref:Uncharacterized protein n=1 Tax=Erwinia piriflorinigrans CFBP 5888 TaxID=1161919 RepID=V5ZD14_9GAMM|nr:hypothetical protein EPIR_3579 [Erwinia piriflorinigrans CFBP 5888]